MIVHDKYAAQLHSAAISVDLDLTFLGQLVLFALLIALLRPLLFEPVLRVFEEREKRTDGVRAQARAMQERAGELLRRYEGELEKVRQAAAQEREALRAELARAEGKILSEAREAAKKIISDGRRRIEKEIGAIRFDLGMTSERLGREIARAVMGREIN